MARPIILLDIDGVLNTWPAFPKHMWDEFQEHLCTDMMTGREYRLVIGQPVIDFFNEIEHQELVDIFWHTTWQASAGIVAEAFGLPLTWSGLDAPEFDLWDRREAKGWWKLPPVKRILAQAEGPVIWIDDDAEIYWVNMLRKECLAEGIDFSRLTVICPDRRSGLSQAHLAKIEHIIDDWKDNQ